MIKCQSRHRSYRSLCGDSLLASIVCDVAFTLVQMAQKYGKTCAQATGGRWVFCRDQGLTRLETA